MKGLTGSSRLDPRLNCYKNCCQWTSKASKIERIESKDGQDVVLVREREANEQLKPLDCGGGAEFREFIFAQ